MTDDISDDLEVSLVDESIQEYMDELEKQHGPSIPFGQETLIQMAWYLTRFDATAPPLNKPHGLDSRTLEQEIKSAKMLADTAFTKWALPTIRLAGHPRHADRINRAKNWDDRFMTSIEAFISDEITFDKMTPLEKAFIAVMNISVNMRKLDYQDGTGGVTIDKRLMYLAAMMADAGYALAWFHQENGREFDLRTEFEAALKNAGIA